MSIYLDVDEKSLLDEAGIKALLEEVVNKLPGWTYGIPQPWMTDNSMGIFKWGGRL